MTDQISISNETLVIVNIATLITIGGVFIRIIYIWARLELTVEFLKQQLDAAHQKIRDLEKLKK